MPYQPPPELAELSIAEIAQLVADRKLPPVDHWHPEQSGNSEMRIAADGRWFHQGGEITRPAMVRAFASLLRRDEQRQHWLVTPHERLTIEVEDAAFMAIDVKQESGALAFKLNTDDLIIAGPDHPIRAAGDHETPALYIAVRHGTEARINRSTYLDVIEIALKRKSLTVVSQGVEYAITPG